MKRSTQILSILLSLALMLTLAMPAAFAEDTVQEGDAEAVQAENTVTAEEIAEEPEQIIEETAEEPVKEDAVGQIAEESQDGITVEEISLDEDKIEESKAKVAKSNINRAILIAGLDNGGRTDLILVLCFTKENEAKVFTVARDTYMQLAVPPTKYVVDGKVREFCKCNRASVYGGMDALMKELNRHLDINIKEYIGVDWACVATFIDAIGGYSVNLTNKDMVNAINELIVSLKKTSKITMGSQKLNGWQTVAYLRVRDYAGGSARVREDRNRDTFARLYKQAKGWKIDKRMLIYNAIAGRVKTNVSPANMKALIEQFQNVNVVTATQYPYTAKTYWDKWGDLNYLVPTTLEKNTIRLHKEVLGQSNYVASNTVKGLSTTIAKKHIKKKVILAKKPKIPSVAKAKVTIGAAAYTGKPVTPSVVVKLKKKKLSSSAYTLTYKNNVNIGKASIIIEGKCGYGGTKTVTFDICPAGTRLTGITAGVKSFTVTWKEQAALMPKKTIDGYQIQYGLKKSFKKAKTKTVAGYTNTTATVSKLKAKKKYYVRVRTYVGSGKSAVYSDWSPAMTVKPTKR